MAPAPRLTGCDDTLAGAYFITIITHKRSFHDHNLRNEFELQKIWLYIEQNRAQLTPNRP